MQEKRERRNPSITTNHHPPSPKWTAPSKSIQACSFFDHHSLLTITLEWQSPPKMIVGSFAEWKSTPLLSNKRKLRASCCGLRRFPRRSSTELCINPPTSDVKSHRTRKMVSRTSSDVQKDPRIIFTRSPTLRTARGTTNQKRRLGPHENSPKVRR